MKTKLIAVISVFIFLFYISSCDMQKNSYSENEEPVNLKIIQQEIAEILSEAGVNSGIGIDEENHRVMIDIHIDDYDMVYQLLNDTYADYICISATDGKIILTSNQEDNNNILLQLLLVFGFILIMFLISFFYFSKIIKKGLIFKYANGGEQTVLSKNIESGIKDKVEIPDDKVFDKILVEIKEGDKNGLILD